MDFLRAYLDIEEAHFGDHLRVEMAIEPEIAGSDIPSLILQPIVGKRVEARIGAEAGTRGFANFGNGSERTYLADG